MADFARFRGMMAGLLADIKGRGPPRADDVSVAAHLLRLRDAQGQPLPDDRLAAEIGVFFTGGFETTGHTIGVRSALRYLAENDSADHGPLTNPAPSLFLPAVEIDPEMADQ